MISKQQVIALIERNPSVGKTTVGEDVRDIRYYYVEIYNSQYKEYHVARRRQYRANTTCHTCIIEMLNALRVYVGYPTLTNTVKPKLSQQRIDICKSCKYSDGEGVLMSCGPFGRKTKVPEGELCGCNLYAKTKISFLYCPLKFWDELGK